MASPNAPNCTQLLVSDIIVHNDIHGPLEGVKAQVGLRLRAQIHFSHTSMVCDCHPC